MLLAKGKGTERGGGQAVSEGNHEGSQPVTPIDPTEFEDIGLVVDQPQIIIRRRSLVSRVPASRVDIEYPLSSLAQRVPHLRRECVLPDPPHQRNLELELKQVETWVMSGEDITSRRGEVSFSLNEKLPCNADRSSNEGEYAWIGGETFFTATPVSDRPVFLTTGITSVAIDPGGGTFEPTDGFDVDITVMSWNPAGEPVGRVAFRWICTALATRYWLPSGEPLPDREDLPDEEDLEVPPV
jgi:hypothetical protein